MGLPSIIITLAENQIDLASEFERYGAAVVAGHTGRWSDDDMDHILSSMTPDRLIKMSDAAIKMVDGQGCSRVADAIITRVPKSRRE